MLLVFCSFSWASCDIYIYIYTLPFSNTHIPDTRSSTFRNHPQPSAPAARVGKLFSAHAEIGTKLCHFLRHSNGVATGTFRTWCWMCLDFLRSWISLMYIDVSCLVATQPFRLRHRHRHQSVRSDFFLLSTRLEGPVDRLTRYSSASGVATGHLEYQRIGIWPTWTSLKKKGSKSEKYGEYIRITY